jgi:hypothetical protein
MESATYSYWRDLLENDLKAFGEKAARKIEAKLHWPHGCLDGLPSAILKSEDTGSTLVAHAMSHQPEQTVTLTREQLMSGVDPVGEFWVALWDDAIGQEQKRGTLTLWGAGLAPEVGDFVMIRTKDGGMHVRVYSESLEHGWVGKPLHSDYAEIPGADARVVAVWLSSRARRSQLRR